MENSGQEEKKGEIDEKMDLGVEEELGEHAGRDGGRRARNDELWAAVVESEELAELCKKEREEAERRAKELEKVARDSEEKVEKLRLALKAEKKTVESLRGAVKALEGRLDEARRARATQDRSDGGNGRAEKKRDIIKLGCQCGEKRCHVQEGGQMSQTALELATKSFAKAMKISNDDSNMMIHDPDFQQKVGKAEKVEALKKFAKTCPAIAKLVMTGGAQDPGWKEAAEDVKEEVKKRNEPQKSIIKEKVIMIGKKLGMRSKMIFELRDNYIKEFVKRFEWKNVEQAIIVVEWNAEEEVRKNWSEFVDEVAKEVQSVLLVPGKMACTYDQVAAVAEAWEKEMKTAANVRMIDPMAPVGAKKMPLILSEPKGGSSEKLVEFLELVLPEHPIVKRIKEEMDEEPAHKRQRAK